MDTLKTIEKLAKAAQNEALPMFDVSSYVLGQMRTVQVQRANLLPIEFFTALAAVAASIVIVLSVVAWQTIVNPMAQLIAPLQESSLW
ncbi:MAG: hypothetical protein WC765_08520 [Phycisphaerae bacterium]|jgi:hypothetical protein|nr:hypothetical protein [Phycisphaerales bacterium]HBR20138.1 hypothetical protein [Phycisphaerales bacterium]